MYIIVKRNMQILSRDRQRSIDSVYQNEIDLKSLLYAQVSPRYCRYFAKKKKNARYVLKARCLDYVNHFFRYLFHGALDLTLTFSRI